MERRVPHYELDVYNHLELNTLSSLANLMKGTVKPRKSSIFAIAERLLRLMVALSVSIATTEKAFSNMKLVKTRLWNKMKDGFL